MLLPKVLSFGIAVSIFAVTVTAQSGTDVVQVCNPEYGQACDGSSDETPTIVDLASSASLEAQATATPEVPADSVASDDGSEQSPTTADLISAFVSGSDSTSTSEYPAGSTLSDGGYVCNPAHSYPGQSCDDSGTGYPTLVDVTTSMPASSTTGPTITALGTNIWTTTATSAGLIATFTGAAPKFNIPAILAAVPAVVGILA